MSLQDKVALITGAGSGIGRAIALALASFGARLLLVGRDVRNLEAVAQEARSGAAEAICLPADLCVDDQIASVVEEVRRQPGRLDLLIHCAGRFLAGPIETTPVANLDQLYRINARVPYLLTQATLPLLRACRGQVVFLNSTAGLSAGAGTTQYAASKHALRAIADGLREEINADGVRVLSIYPGRTASPMQKEVHALEGRGYQPERLMQPEDVAAMVVSALSLPHSAEATDIRVRPLRKP